MLTMHAICLFSKKFVSFLYKTKYHFLAKVTKIWTSVSLYGIVIRHSP